MCLNTRLRKLKVNRLQDQKLGLQDRRINLDNECNNEKNNAMAVYNLTIEAANSRCELAKKEFDIAISALSQQIRDEKIRMERLTTAILETQANYIQNR